MTLQKKTLQCNPKIQLSNDGGNLTSDTGMVLVEEFLAKVNFSQMITDTMTFQDKRKYATHSMADLLKQVIYQLIAGYKSDAAANRLAQDPIFTTLFSKKRLASQPTISRFINHFNHSSNEGLHQLTQKLGDLLLTQKNQQEMIIDIDSTHSDTFGNQESTNYNGHYQTNGYHPLVAFDGVFGLLLGAKLRPGNDYTSKDSEHFLRPILQRYRDYSCDMALLVRGDSGFAKPEIYSLCDELDAQFIIRLKANRKLQKIAESLITYGDETDFTQSESQYFSINDYQPDSWSNDYRVIIKSTRQSDSLLFTHEFLVTNLAEISTKDCFKLYQNRGVMENYIKEVKRGFFFDKTDSSRFETNEARMLFSCIAYNIIHLMKSLVFQEKDKRSTIATLRFKLFHIAGKVSRHARNIQIALSSSYVYETLFWQIFKRIQELVIL